MLSGGLHGSYNCNIICHLSCYHLLLFDAVYILYVVLEHNNDISRESQKSLSYPSCISDKVNGDFLQSDTLKAKKKST